jgi:hypothetical protein
MEVGDWSVADEIRAEVYLPADADGQVLSSLTSGQRTEGMSEDDGYRFNAIVSPRGGNIWEGWREFRFPAECYYTCGIPGGWSEMVSGSLSGLDGIRFRNVRLIHREVRPGPRMTDEGLIDALDLDQPGLEAARAAGSVEDQLREIAGHFRSSSFDRHHVPREERAEVDPAAADAILAGEIAGQHWPDGIDWDANPYGYIEWSIGVHGMSYLRPLERAWYQMRDAKYALGIERILVDWMARNPVPFGVRAGGLAWGHSLVVGNRAYSTLVDVFAVVCDCPETDDRTVIDLLKTYYEHVIYLLAFQSFPPSNKTISEGRAIFASGCSFPEFAESEDWRTEGARRLLDDMEVQVLPDGASYELTPGYQMAIASWFLDALKVARKFDRPLDPELEGGIRRMYDWCVSIGRPDFSRPSVSDAGSTDAKYRAALTDPGRLLGNAAAVWVGTEGQEGEPPEYTSAARQDSGYFAMRSGWDLDARYLLFEGGPFGRFHQHEDMLSIDVYAYGTPFIVDPGITSYYPNPWTTFYRTTEAHNTVLVDGCGQERRVQSIPEWVESARERTVWRSDAARDVAVATFDGPYAGLDAEVRHRRAVMFVKPDYFIVFDELLGEGHHVYEALFHFMPFRVLIDPVTRAVRTGRMRAPNIEILPLVRMTPRLVCGQNDPVQGWLALSGQDVPAPVAIYKKRAKLPFRTGYIIYPFGSDRVTAEVSAKVTKRGDVWTLRIHRPDGEVDRVKIDWASGQGPDLASNQR